MDLLFFCVWALDLIHDIPFSDILFLKSHLPSSKLEGKIKFHFVLCSLSFFTYKLYIDFSKALTTAYELGQLLWKKENEFACEPVFSPSPLETNYYICSTIARGTEPSRRLGKAIRQHALSAQHPASQDAALSFADYPCIQRVATSHELLEELQVQFGVARADCAFI